MHPLEKVAIEKVSLPESEKVNFQPREHQLWMVTEGSFDLSFPSGPSCRVYNRQLIFLPGEVPCTCLTHSTVHLFRFRLPGLPEILQNMYSQSLECKLPFSSSSFSPLPVTPLLREYTRHLSVLMEISPFPALLVNLQISYLFLLMKEAYPSKRIAALFSPLLSSADPFTRFIWENSKGVKRVSTLARLCNVSVRSLERLFNQAFGMPPGRWLLERRIEQVYREITQTGEPFTLIADKCGFNTLAQLTDFCRKHLGVSPSKLREDAIT